MSSLRYLAEDLEVALGGASDEALVAAAEDAAVVRAVGSAADAVVGADQGAAEVPVVAPDPVPVASSKARSR